MTLLRIGTRGSLLALAQTKIIADTISDSWPDIKIDIVKITTSGDKNMSPFSSDPSGIKGMFTREIEQALLNHDIDFAVHSLKDLPANMNPELPIAAYSHRADPRDALLLNDKADSDAIGSSSLRRRLQLERLYPHTNILPIRGNITTRLRRLDSGEFRGLVLAVSGLERLGMSQRITRIFSPEEVMPAPGQGILACQGRLDGEYNYLGCVDDSDSRDCALAERAFSRALNAACSIPIGAYAVVHGETLTLKGLYVREATREFFRGEISGKRSDAEALGQKLAEVIMS
ncbi:MAG: hydroxymethylbilane synthase [Synergistaceae bacterium]|nr:hydroxymethylbilane synthase [Synergistaceae bacterium]MBR0035243.1 hydroxymethylbilane synthase [Synergistaceae bacterium]